MTYNKKNFLILETNRKNHFMNTYLFMLKILKKKIIKIRRFNKFI